MPRRVVRPYGSSIPASRVISLLFALAIMWMLYTRMGDPATWRWLGYAEDPEPSTVAAQVATPTASANEELLIPGPNDLDPPELENFKGKLELVVNKAPLKPREMLLYWQLMEWACTQKTRDLEKRSITDASFSQVWEEPKKYQGKLLKLRMHVRRVLHYDTPRKDDGTPNNELGLKSIYEMWGWTEDSKSFPYVVVFPEKPEGLKTGPDVTGEVVFVGYFLKIMEYEDFEGKKRGAPLLIGRTRLVGPAMSSKPAPSDTGLYISLAIGVLVLAAAFYAYTTFQAKRAGIKPLPSNLPELGVFGGSEVPFDANSSGSPFRIEPSSGDEPPPAGESTPVEDQTPIPAS